MLLGIFGLPVNPAQAQEKSSFRVNGRKIKTKKFNQEVTAMMGQMGVPGMSMAVIDNNEVVYYKAYGVRKLGGDPVNQQTVFNGCSLSKSLLVFVAHQLVDEGRLDLDKPIHEYLTNDYLKHDERYKQITPRMLLSHSSGIENWSYQNNASMLEILTNPGTAFVYSGTGYNYLASAIEKILGQTYEEYVSERVLNPLGMDNTFLKFTETASGEELPANYAVGHQIQGRFNTINNRVTHPAAGNHYTAKDYATLVIAMFASDHISKERKRDLLEPLAVINDSEIAYGPGFEVGIVEGDTIVSHGGDSDGYKNLFFYSVTQKKGFVFFSNIDWGKAMAARLNELTVELNITPFLESRYNLREQYPSMTTSLLKVSNEEGYDDAFEELDRLKALGKIDLNTLNSLASVYLWYGNYKMAEKLLNETLKEYPNSATAYSLMAQKNLNRQEYYEARDNLLKAKQLGFDLWEIDSKLEASQKGATELDRRKSLFVNISTKDTTTIQAEDYNDWGGVVKVVAVIDQEVNTKGLGDFDDGNWVGFNANVPESGEYAVMVRAISPGRESHLELRSGDTVLAKIVIPESNTWSSWKMPVAKVTLAAGDQSLRLAIPDGYSLVNWLKVVPVK